MVAERIGLEYSEDESMTGVWILLVVMQGYLYTTDFNSEVACKDAGTQILAMGLRTGVPETSQDFACVWKGQHDYKKRPKGV